MPRRTWRLLVGLTAWTLFVWTTRIGNIWADEGRSLGGKAASTVLAVTLVGLAIAAAVVAVRTRHGRVAAGDIAVVRILAGWTIVVWLQRAATILFGDRSWEFKAVHQLLAVVSVGIAIWLLRILEPGAHADSDGRPGREPFTDDTTSGGPASGGLASGGMASGAPAT